MPIDCPSSEAKPIDLVEAANGQANLPNHLGYAPVGACEKPGRTPVQECGTKSVVQATGRARPRCIPWPPAGSDGLRKRKQDVLLRVVIGEGGGGGVKADKADIFPKRLVEWRLGALWARAAVAHPTIPFEDFLAELSSIGAPIQKLSNPPSIRPHPDLGISSFCQLRVRPTCQRNGSCHHRPKISDAPRSQRNDAKKFGMYT